MKKLLALGVLLVVASCVTEYQPDSLTIPPSLIVEGQITDQPGPYVVRLTRTADYSIRSINLLETGATLTFEDDQGNKETLREVSSGNYQTRADGIRGVPGRRYKLIIQTKAGKRYESEQELLRAAPPILNAYYEYRADPIALTTDLQNGWDVYIDTKDSEEPGDFYRYEWTHYEPINICNTVVNARNNTYYDLLCCTSCWDITRCYDCLNVNSDANINGKTLSRQFITRVPYTGSTRYYLEIEQQAISKGAYEFWKSVRQLTKATGGLFDAAPATVRGNLRCVNDPGLAVYGYFGATGMAVVPLWVDRKDGRGNPPITRAPVLRNPPDACFPCENSIYRTPNKPRWWVY